jgi:hypothetical protein
MKKKLSEELVINWRPIYCILGGILGITYGLAFEFLSIWYWIGTVAVVSAAYIASKTTAVIDSHYHNTVVERDVAHARIHVLERRLGMRE